MNVKTIKRPTFIEALVPITFLIIIISVSILKFGADPQIPLLLATIVAVLLGFKLGYKWDDMEKGMISTINSSMQAILIQMIIGIIIGTWILAGIVPTMIYYGLQILSPAIFLPSAAILCAIISVATGSAWTTAGTVGIALLGVGQGLGMPLPLVAGTIISGAYFGDKMSPLSDSTNLAAAVTEVKLFDHIGHMLKTTSVSFVIALILYGFVGMKYSGSALDTAQINQLLDALKQHFHISPILLLPPILVVSIVIMKVPAVPGLLCGGILGGIFAIIFQKSTLADVILVSHYGFNSQSGFEAMDSLLSRGGLDSMMYTVSLIIVAMCFGGVIEKIKVLEVIAEKLLIFTKTRGSLVLTTALSSIFCNFTMADQYLAIVVPGRMFRKSYEEKNLKLKNLSRVLEDSGTLTSSLVPWSTCGAFMLTTLGVHPFAYLPFAFLNLINPIVSIIYGYTGFTMEKDEILSPSKEIDDSSSSQELINEIE
ncbi:Na+/H+ antiporter NhaC [Cetobacterium sp.]|uniref:Na+/H+ antiporter NhaC n=1 Tax=Cetobacterium sp. TaxID=2071632 RepID=UPI003EE56F8E